MRLCWAAPDAGEHLELLKRECLARMICSKGIIEVERYFRRQRSAGEKMNERLSFDARSIASEADAYRRIRIFALGVARAMTGRGDVLKCRERAARIRRSRHLCSGCVKPSRCCTTSK